MCFVLFILKGATRKQTFQALDRHEQYGPVEDHKRCSEGKRELVIPQRRLETTLELRKYSHLLRQSAYS
eukprot:4921725-Amphidinium_carterae.1